MADHNTIVASAPKSSRKDKIKEFLGLIRASMAAQIEFFREGIKITPDDRIDGARAKEFNAFVDMQFVAANGSGPNIIGRVLKQKQSLKFASVQEAFEDIFTKHTPFDDIFNKRGSGHCRPML